MKINMGFKTPDVMDYTNPPAENIPQEKWDKFTEIANRFIRYGEYINVEVDTERGTMSIVEL